MLNRIIALLLLTVATLTSSATATPTSVSIVLPARAGWRDTGVDIEADQRVTVVAYGSWSLGGRPANFVDSNGFVGVTHKDAIVPAAPIGALVGRVSSKTFAASGDLPEALSGRLYLAINDVEGSFDDNIGLLTVTIRLRKR